MKKILFLCAAFSFSLSAGTSAETFDLKACLDYAGTNSAEVREVSYKRVTYLSNVKEAEGAKDPKISILTYVAPAYKITGNESYYEKDYSVWGPYWHTKIEAQMPIYTWGKIDYYRNAALNGVKVAENETEQKKGEVEYEVNKYYYGLLLARTLDGVVDDVIKILDEAITKGKELYEKGEGDIKKSELEMLRVYMAEAQKNKHEAEKSVIMARLALMQKMGMPENQDFDIAEKKIKKISYELKTPDYYVELAFRNRPEWKMVNYGLEARNFLVKAEEADRYPVFFLAGELNYNRAPEIADQKNPWSYDQFNSFDGGVAVGAKFDFTPKAAKAKIESKKADLDALKEKGKFARDGIKLQVKNSYYTALEAFKNIDSAKKGLDAAEKWIMAAGLVYGLGTGDVKDALEGVGARAKAQKDYYQAIYDYNLAAAELAKNCGLRNFDNE